jgi:(5-formylfuran-3-yl)methyl phosphate synthase
MRLLVSVRSAGEVAAAVSGGADIVDAKDPSLGSLGAVSARELGSIADQVPLEMTLSIALGDPADTQALEHAMTAVGQLGARRGAAYVKIGLAGTADYETLLAATVRMAAQTALSPAVIAVAYADGAGRHLPTADAATRLVVRAGAAGLLLDTQSKNGFDLFHFMPMSAVRTWASEARAAGLLTAVAGSLSIEGVRATATLPADIVGVRGAACEGGREGIIARHKVSELRAAVLQSAGAMAK